MEHGEIVDLRFRIAKLGTRPKGGSPQDNFILQQMTAKRNDPMTAKPYDQCQMSNGICEMRNEHVVRGQYQC